MDVGEGPRPGQDGGRGARPTLPGSPSVPGCLQAAPCLSTVMPHPQRFSGESVVSWSDLDITISVPWYLGLMFRTRKADGVLMEATAGMSSRLHLQVSENPAPGPVGRCG